MTKSNMPEHIVSRNPDPKEVAKSWAEHNANKKIVALAREKNDRLAKEGSKQRLVKAVEKHIRTSFIGALDAFEKEFGYLWGHGKDVEELSEDELTFREVWNRARDKVLDNGNDRIKNASEEIDQYNVEWNKFQTNFVVKRR